MSSTPKDFEVLAKLGQGSFGTVFKVRRKADHKTYVMKTINIAGMDRRGQEEAINEVNILSSLDNPYIVKYYDSFIDHNVLYIIMEHCSKGDLCNLLRLQAGRLLPEARVWKFFLQMCLGLEYLHSMKILHRDMKSMNVFLADKDSVRIGDLGVAKVLSNTAAYAHTMVGTPYYLSPELCEERPYNAKSDVWALGCILYELCTLKPPFDALNQGALILKIIRGKYTPLGDNFSEELRDLVHSCLVKDLRKRPTVKQILLRPGIKEKAAELGVSIPKDSVLSQVFLRVEGQVMTPSIAVRPTMPTIEEEIFTQPVSFNEAPKPSKPKVLPSRPIKLRKPSDVRRTPEAPVPLKKRQPVPVEALKPVTPFRRESHYETKCIEDRQMVVLDQPKKRTEVLDDLDFGDVPEVMTLDDDTPLDENIQESESLEEVKTDNEYGTPDICSPSSSDASYSDSFERAEGSLDSSQDEVVPPRVSTPTEDQAWLYGLQEVLAVPTQATPEKAAPQIVYPSTPETFSTIFIPTVLQEDNPQYTVVFAKRSNFPDYNSSDDEPYDDSETFSPDLRNIKFIQTIESNKATFTGKFGTTVTSELLGGSLSNFHNPYDFDDSEPEHSDSFVKSRVA
mmetsp:Transcript_29248/g.52279  ORF Transcript_29248/g.52279 Transcript_29248/m.52279 type:complete len:621 (+) Transcript_29248:1233-3095(+)